MIEFVDLKTGYIFNGMNPYVFWFDGEQSTNLIYTKNICILSDKQELSIEIQKNPTFILLNLQSQKIINKLDNDNFSINYIKYDDIKTNKYTSIGKKYQEKLYLHNIYIAASNKIAGEYREQITISNINDQSNLVKINIGIDLYDENESLYINLANMGVEIPESFQKAIYDSNIKEDYKDNILINRKFKELLFNYWDIIANKGSYKSLINSLKWFEYRDEKGDLVRLREIWKGKNGPIDTYLDKDLCSILKDKYKDLIYNYSKTSYFALQAVLERINQNKYDSEKNPELEKIIYKWSIEDLSLKMTLLGQFYEVLFMPIHTSLIHSTIEDIVFTNTIKTINSHIIDRYDYNYSTNYIKCNIKDHQIFKLNNVDARVTNSTVFKNEVIDSHVPVIGVDDIRKGAADKVIKTFSDQYYTGVGAIIPIELEIIDMDKNDNIKQVQIRLQDDDSDEWIVKTFYDYFPDNKIKFNLLCKKEKDYKVLITIITKSCKTYTRDINWSVVDMDNCYIEINKLMPDLVPKITKPLEVKDYLFGIQNKNNFDKNNLEQYYYTQYFSQSTIKKNNIVIFNITKMLETDIQELKTKLIQKKYEIFEKTNLVNKYIMGVCTIFSKKLPDEIKNNYKKYIIRNDFGFVPQFYHYTPLYKQGYNPYYKLDDFKINPINDVLCVKPHIKYGKYINDYEWEFKNASTGEQIKLPASSQNPFINPLENQLLPDGFYDIIFKCSLIDGQIKTLKLDSAFIIAHN